MTSAVAGRDNKHPHADRQQRTQISVDSGVRTTFTGQLALVYG